MARAGSTRWPRWEPTVLGRRHACECCSSGGPGPPRPAGGPVLLYGARHRGARRCAAELPVALELVASELRTGGTVAGALGALGSGAVGQGNASPLTAEFARITRRCDLGAPLEDALTGWAN